MSTTMADSGRIKPPRAAPPTELRPVQEAAAVALASGATLEAAAKSSGAGLSTLKVWLSTVPALPARVAQLRGELTGRAVGLLSCAMADAAMRLRHLCNESESEAVQLKAATSLLDHGLRVRESVEIEARLTALEAGRES